MTATIYETYASVAVEPSVDELLARIPGGAALRERVLSGWSGASTKYDEGTEAAYFLASDGKTLACYIVKGVDAEQANSIASILQNETDWTAGSVVHAVEKALGGTAQRAQ
jgi:hypothetical protein